MRNAWIVGTAVADSKCPNEPFLASKVVAAGGAWERVTFYAWMMKVETSIHLHAHLNDGSGIKMSITAFQNLLRMSHNE